jgi:hypothetical protein
VYEGCSSNFPEEIPSSFISFHIKGGEGRLWETKGDEGRCRMMKGNEGR